MPPVPPPNVVDTMQAHPSPFCFPSRWLALRRRARLALVLATGALGASFAHAAAATFKPEKLAAMDTAVAEAISTKKIPGGVLWFEREGEIYRKAYGQRALSPTAEPISEDTIYDAASLTKVVSALKGL